MQIRTLSIVCMSVLALMTTCLGGWLLVEAVNDYHIAGRVERALRVDGILLGVADAVSLDRVPTADALTNDAPANEAARARIEATRTRFDTVLRQSIEQLSSSGAADQVQILKQIADGMLVYREQIDKAINLPRNRRDASLLPRFLASIQAPQAAIDRALDLSDMQSAQQDGTLDELVQLAGRAWSLRVLIPLRSTVLVPSITAAAPLTGAEIERIVAAQARIDQTWEAINVLTRRLSVVPDLAAVVASAQAAFEKSNAMHLTALEAGRHGGTYPMTAAEYGHSVVAGSMTAFAIRDAALAAALKRTAGHRHRAAIGVGAAAAVVLLSMAGTVGVLVLLNGRIVGPVLALTEVIGRIARLDFDVAIPGLEHNDEIGRMAAALEALRAGAMAGEENKARIVHMAHHDGLTGLVNRMALHDRMEQAVAMTGRGHTSAVLCLDLDRFKAVNDTFGHPVGDLLLKSVAARLLACVRDGDTVSRLGGDEFVVLLVDLDASGQALMAAKRIVSALHEPFDLDGRVFSIGASVGIALAPQDATSAVAQLKCADIALYRAKAEAKGTWRFFEPEMDAHLQERLVLERDLREAAQNESFELAYQPVYSLAADRFCGFEALLRWRHPRRGTVGPAAFIPIAEETGLIVPIGAWVLRQACREAMHWPDHMKVAVNLSAVQFRNHDLVETVRQALAESGLPPSRLELEITESVLLTSNDSILAMLHDMHDMGIHVAMDDFGTGYSSLSYLRSFPFDTIKIDQSFVCDMCHDESSRAIVRSVVALANSLEMTTTAEGVETADQLAELRRQGATDVQGYFFGKPVCADQARVLAGSRLRESIAS